jgi:hypothetical protein
MRRLLSYGRTIVLLGAAVATLSGCLGDNCRPGRDSDRGRHHCDRDRGDRHHYY